MKKCYERNHFKAFSNSINKKKLYKKGKNWVVGSLTLLALAGLGFTANHLVHADGNANTRAATTSVSGTADIEHKAKVMYNGMIAKGMTNSLTNQPTHNGSAKLNNIGSSASVKSGTSVPENTDNKTTNSVSSATSTTNKGLSTKTAPILHMNLGTTRNFNNSQPRYNVTLFYYDMTYHSDYTQSDDDPVDAVNLPDYEEEGQLPTPNPMIPWDTLSDMTSSDINKYLASHIKNLGHSYNNFIVHNPSTDKVEYANIPDKNDYVLTTPSFPKGYILANTAYVGPWSDDNTDNLYSGSQDVNPSDSYAHNDRELFSLAKNNSLRLNCDTSVVIYVIKPHYIHVHYYDAVTGKLLYKDNLQMLASMQLNPKTTHAHITPKNLFYALREQPVFGNYFLVTNQNNLFLQDLPSQYQNNFQLDAAKNAMVFSNGENNVYTYENSDGSDPILNIYVYQPGIDRVEYVNVNNNEILKRFGYPGYQGVTDPNINQTILRNNVPRGYYPTNKGDQVINSNPNFKFNKSIIIPVSYPSNQIIYTYNGKQIGNPVYSNEQGPSTQADNDLKTFYNNAKETNTWIQKPDGYEIANPNDFYTQAENAFRQNGGVYNNTTFRIPLRIPKVHIHIYYKDNKTNSEISGYPESSSTLAEGAKISASSYIKNIPGYRFDKDVQQVPSYEANGDEDYTIDITYSQNQPSYFNSTVASSATETINYIIGHNIVSKYISVVNEAQDALVSANNNEDVISKSDWKANNAFSLPSSAVISGWTPYSSKGNIPLNTTDFAPSAYVDDVYYSQASSANNMSQTSPASQSIPSLSSANSSLTSITIPSKRRTKAIKHNSSSDVSPDYMKPAHQRIITKKHVKHLSKRIKELIHKDHHDRFHITKHHYIKQLYYRDMHNIKGSRSYVLMNKYNHSNNMQIIHINRKGINKLPQTDEPQSYSVLYAMLFVISAVILADLGRAIDRRRHE